MESSHFKVTVKRINGKDFVFDVSTDMTVKQLKQLIQQKKKIPIKHQVIQIKHNRLDDDFVLYSSQISNEVVVALYQELRGGGDQSSITKGFEIISKNALERAILQDNGIPSAPDHRTPVLGLNLYGICKNSDCELNGEAIIIQYGLGSFDCIMLWQFSKCLKCKKKASIFDIVLQGNCFWLIFGIMTKDQKAFDTGIQQVTDENYIYFNTFEENEEEDKLWNSMKCIAFQNKEEIENNTEYKTFKLITSE